MYKRFWVRKVAAGCDFLRLSDCKNSCLPFSLLGKIKKMAGL